MAFNVVNTSLQIVLAGSIASRFTDEEEYGRLIAILIRISPNKFAAEDMGEEFAEDSVFAFFHHFPNILIRYLSGYFEYRIRRFEISVPVLHPEGVTSQEAYFKYMDNYLAFFAGMRKRTEELLQEGL